MKLSILPLFISLISAKSWNRKISNCLKQLNPHKRLDCFCGNPTAYRKYCWRNENQSHSVPRGQDDFWLMKTNSTKVTMDQCSFCQQLHFWTRYQKCYHGEGDCNQFEVLLEKFLPENTTISSDFDECKTGW